MRIALAYLIPIDEWRSYGTCATRFADTLQRFPPQIEHELHVVCCNGDATEELRNLFAGIPCRFAEYRGKGRDCGAAQSMARQVDCDFLVCANAGVYFHRAGWLKRFVEARNEHGKGVYGATASFESFPYVAGRRNPHIRTSFFGCNPRTFRDFPCPIDSRDKCLRFECGDWNFTRWCEDRDEPGYLVTWDGCYASGEFRSGANVFRKGDQSNLLIRDRHIDWYQQADVQQQVELETRANGGTPPERHVAKAHAAESLSMSTPALVSIGMPVYNGGRYLREALKALVAQDYPHFELIVSDNCSTDDTESICRDFAVSDPRIRYVRQPENRGSPWNFKFVAEAAHGKCFMWAAHDDTRSASYVSKCLAKLNANPAAVLCCTEVNFIDGDGHPSRHYAGYRNLETLGMPPVKRIHELISKPGWFALYGLMRTEAMRRTSLGLDTYGCDVVLLMELLLQGDFVKVPEPLFNFRILIEGKSAEDYQKDFNLARPASRTPYAGLAVQLLNTVYRSQLSTHEKDQVLADFLGTLSEEDLPWRKAIPHELLGTQAALSTPEFANLLGLVLLRAVPLEALQRSPIAHAVFCGSAKGFDLLAVARELACAREQSKPGPRDRDYYQKAGRLAELGRLAEASEMFRGALQDRETSEGWSDWASVQIARGLIADAERGLRRALSLDATNRGAASKLGILLAGEGRFREAIPALENCVSIVSAKERPMIEALLTACRRRLAPSAAPALRIADRGE